MDLLGRLGPATVLLAISTSLVNAANRLVVSHLIPILHASSPFSSDFYYVPIQRVLRFLPYWYCCSLVGDG